LFKNIKRSTKIILEIAKTIVSSANEKEFIGKENIKFKEI